MGKAKLSIFVAGLWRGGASKPPDAPDVTGIDPGGGGPAASTACPGVWRAGLLHGELALLFPG